MAPLDRKKKEAMRARVAPPSVTPMDEREEERTSVLFSAKFDGHCVGACDGPIVPGERIRSAEGGGYMHDGCEAGSGSEGSELPKGARYKFQGTTLEEMGY